MPGSLVDRVLRQAGKPLHRLYYRALFASRVPGAAAVGRLVARWEALSRRGDVPVAADVWERQYRRGDWECLHLPQEMPRYAVLVGYLRRLAPRASVLDLGCGDGELFRQLLAHGPRRYTGVDLSAEAVEEASAGVDDPDVEFVVADAETYRPAAPPGAVVANECLYYFRDPLATIDRYWQGRAPGGILLWSMYSTPRSRAILRGLRRRLPVLDELTLVQRRHRWLLGVAADPDD